MGFAKVESGSWSLRGHDGLQQYLFQLPVPHPQSHTQQTSYNGTYGMSQFDNGPPVPKQQDSSTMAITVLSISY